ncbi:MDR family MFS transporter [Lentimicrobium sp.]
MMLAAMDNTIVATAIPQIVGDLGGFSLFSWLFSIYLLIQTITIPVYGKLADLYGRRPVLIFGIIVFLAGSVACGGAWNMHSLIVARGIQAIGAGAIMGTVNTIAGDIYTLQERAKVQGWLSSIWGISAILGPALGGALAQYVSWRWIFFINVPVGIGSIVLIMLFLHENKPESKAKVDWAGAFAMMLTGTIIMFTLLEGGRAWPWFSLPALGLIVLSAIMFYLTIRIESKSNEPILPHWVWRKRILLGANLATIGMGTIMMGPNMYLPVFAQSVTGLGAIAAGFLLASMSITWPISSSLSGKLYLRIGFRNTAIAGIIIVILGSATFLLLRFPGPVWVLLAIQLMLGAGFGLISTSMLIGVQSTVVWAQRGLVTGTNMFSRYFGQSIGAAIFASLFNTILDARLRNAPPGLQSQLPGVNKVIEVLQSHSESSEVSLYLREAFFESTHYVYLSMVIVGFITLLILLKTPSRFSSISPE